MLCPCTKLGENKDPKFSVRTTEVRFSRAKAHKTCRLNACKKEEREREEKKGDHEVFIVSKSFDNAAIMIAGPRADDSINTKQLGLALS